MSLPTTKPIQPSIRSFFTTTTNAPKPSPSPSRITSSHHPGTKKQQPSSCDDIIIPPPPPSLPASATIRVPTEADIVALRRINALLLQVSYPESFYAYAANNPFSRVITWSQDDDDGRDPKIVGAIVCRVEVADEPRKKKGKGSTDDDRDAPPPQQLYIRSLCLLSPYRSRGLAEAALKHVLATVTANKLNVVSVAAHVWTENEDGLQWYDKRGFARDAQPQRGYYLKLRPDTAWVVRRDIAPSKKDTLSENASALASFKPVLASVTAAVVNLPPGPRSAPPSTKSVPPPPPLPGARRPDAFTGKSYQNQRPEMEWNDLPADMAPPKASLRKTGSESALATSARSSSAALRKKKDRSYPAAAFGASS